MVPPPYIISLVGGIRTAYFFAKLTGADSSQTGKEDFHRRPFLRFRPSDKILGSVTVHEPVEGIDPF